MFSQSFSVAVAPPDPSQPPRFEAYVVQINPETLEIAFHPEDSDPAEEARAFATAVSQVCEDLDDLEAVYRDIFDWLQARGSLVGGGGYSEEPVDLAAALEGAARAARNQKQAALLERESRWPDLSEKLASCFEHADLESDALESVQEQYDLDTSPEGLVESLEFVIAIEPAETMEHVVSKRGGSPDLPDALSWPEGEDVEFVAQFSFEELRPFDVYEVFPLQGVMYVFQSGGGTKLDILYSDEPVERADDSGGVSLVFRPSWYFEQSTDTHASDALVEALPDAVLREVKAVLGMDEEASAVSKDSDRFFGEEMDWQAMGWLLDEPLLMHLIHRDCSLNVGMSLDDLLVGDFSAIEYAPSGT